MTSDSKSPKGRMSPPALRPKLCDATLMDQRGITPDALLTMIAAERKNSGACPSDHRPDQNQRVPPCSCLSRRGLETTERTARAERRPTLTGPVRVGPQHVWVGAKKRDSESNKETGM